MYTQFSCGDYCVVLNFACMWMPLGMTNINPPLHADPGAWIWNGFHSLGVIRQVIMLCTHLVGIWLADYRSTMVYLLVTIASRCDDAGLQMVTPNTTPQATRLKSLPSPPNAQWVGWSIQQTHHYRQVPWLQDALTQETICMWHCSHCRIRKPSPWGTTMLVRDVDMPQNTRIHTRLSWWTWWSSFKWYANNQVAQSTLAHSQVSREQYHHWENCLVKTLSNGVLIFQMCKHVFKRAQVVMKYFCELWIFF